MGAKKFTSIWEKKSEKFGKRGEERTDGVGKTLHLMGSSSKGQRRGSGSRREEKVERGRGGGSIFKKKKKS